MTVARALLVAILALLAFPLVDAHAQATRTWVSGVGDDVNPCSRTAPCKTFAGAISKTAAGGEISVLDPGGFGGVTITKSISIIARGMEGSILVGGANGVIINAGPNDEVTLHGLTFEGAGTGINAIRVISARAVHISNCLIRGFEAVDTGRGISVEPTGATVVNVSDCTISKNGQGVFVSPQTGGVPKVTLTRVTLSDNSQQALRVTRKASTVFLNQSVITGNNRGMVVGSGASVISFGNNVIAGNKVDGAPTQTLPLQ